MPARLVLRAVSRVPGKTANRAHGICRHKYHVGGDSYLVHNYRGLHGTGRIPIGKVTEIGWLSVR